MKQFFNCAIVGGGVAGFTAAIALAEHGLQDIIILEGGERVCRKLSASGNGQGNIANANLSIDRYHGSFVPLAERIFARFSLPQILSFYKRCGIYTKTLENGRVYPLSRQASAVTDCLRERARQLSIKEATGIKVTSVKGGNTVTLLTDTGQTISAKYAILACGGAAAPNMSCGTGYELMLKHGHKLAPLLPSLVRLTTKERYPVLAGIRMEAVASLYGEGKLIARAEGDVQFNQYGISGSAVFELSGSAVRSVNTAKITQLALDFLPDTSEGQLSAILRECGESLPITLSQALISVIPKQLIQTVCEKSGIASAVPCNTLKKTDYDKVAGVIKNFYVTITGSLGLENAQVTAGGLTADGFTDSLMSRFMPRVYACGEMLDLDGDCGGFNIMWAVASALTAAEDLAQKIVTLA